MRGADVASRDPSEIVFDESVGGGRGVDEAEGDEQQAGAKCERNRSTAGRKRQHPSLRLIEKRPEEHQDLRTTLDELKRQMR